MVLARQDLALQVWLEGKRSAALSGRAASFAGPIAQQVLDRSPARRFAGQPGIEAYEHGQRKQVAHEIHSIAKANVRPAAPSIFLSQEDP